MVIEMCSENTIDIHGDVEADVEEIEETIFTLEELVIFHTSIGIHWNWTSKRYLIVSLLSISTIWYARIKGFSTHKHNS